jgi:hypothetical protein
MKFTRKHVAEMPKTMAKYGLEYTLIRKEGLTTIYHAKTPEGGDVFEVGLSALDKDHRGIIYPTTSQWGKFGFTTITRDSADSRFDQLRNKELSRETVGQIGKGPTNE